MSRLGLRLNRISAAICVGSFLVIAIMVIKTVVRWNNLDWSFHNDTAEITVGEPGYERAMDSWACMDYTGTETQFLDALAASDRENGAGSVQAPPAPDKANPR